MTDAEIAAAPRPRLLVPSLGIAQIVSWGTLIYAFALLQAPMAGDLQTSTTSIMGAFSVALAFQGVGAPVVGRLIARFGGRAVLGWGAVLSAAVFAAMALSTQARHFWLLAPFLGAAQAATMYEAAFSTLTQHSGDRARATISRVTLFGGLASSVFWPVTSALLDHMGWRDICLIFASLHLVLCLPLVLWQVPPGTGATGDDGRPAPNAEPGQATHAGVARDRRTRRAAAVYLAVAFAFHALVASAFGVHAIGLIGMAGIATADAVGIAALFGPMQVVGRIIETVMGKRFDPRWSGLVALGLVPLAVAALWLLPARWRCDRLRLLVRHVERRRTDRAGGGAVAVLSTRRLPRGNGPDRGTVAVRPGRGAGAVRGPAVRYGRRGRPRHARCRPSRDGRVPAAVRPAGKGDGRTEGLGRCVEHPASERTQIRCSTLLN